tara:strand:+ start:579 stop:764 length:186 start_codon:yes stop_codon:yes gene_type:complete
MRLFDFDTIKVFFASGFGLGNWLTEIDMVIKIAISLASLVYIVLKCREILRGRDDRVDKLK